MVQPLHVRVRQGLIIRLEGQLGWMATGAFAVLEELERFLVLKAHEQDYFCQKLEPSGAVPLCKRQCIRKSTPNIFSFCLQSIYLQDQSIPKRFCVSLRTKPLIRYETSTSPLPRVYYYSDFLSLICRLRTSNVCTH